MSNKLKIEETIKDIKAGFQDISESIQKINPTGMSSEGLKEGAELCDDINKLTSEGHELKGSVENLKKVFQDPEFDNNPDVRQEQKQELNNKNKNKNKNKHTLKNTMGREEG